MKNKGVTFEKDLHLKIKGFTFESYRLRVWKGFTHENQRLYLCKIKILQGVKKISTIPGHQQDLKNPFIVAIFIYLFIYLLLDNIWFC